MSKYNPADPDYDPLAVPPADPATGVAPLPAAAPAPAPTSIASQAAAMNGVTPAPAPAPIPDNAQVSTRVNSLISADNPLMQTAETQARQQAQARGIGASSLAVQAGRQAVINTALPIATADTTANLQSKSLAEQARQFDVTNSTQQSQFSQNLALQQKNLDAQIDQFAQSMGLSRDQLALSRDSMNAQQKLAYDQLAQQKEALTQQLAQNQSQFQATQSQQLVMQNADNALKMQLAEMDSKWRTDVNSSTNIANAWGTMMQSIEKIQNNPELNAQTKAQLIANQTAGFASFATFWKQSTGINVDDLLNFNTTAANTAANTPAPPPPLPPTPLPSVGGGAGDGGNDGGSPY